jgi:Delta3-Delta2-enoyl-CoA isomerase
MFALAHDARVMRSDRGYLCMNEIDLPGALTPGFVSLLKLKVGGNATVLRNMILLGHRFTAEECLKYGMADAIVKGSEETIIKSKEIAKLLWAPKAKAGPVFAFLKGEMVKEAYTLLQRGDLGFVEKSLKL